MERPTWPWPKQRRQQPGDALSLSPEREKGAVVDLMLIKPHELRNSRKCGRTQVKRSTGLAKNNPTRDCARKEKKIMRGKDFRGQHHKVDRNGTE
ncbi:hypothetical protein RRG08_054848 [Elysia crispata]|uniref:Uncharacterized protein n=1 Tax=Elysia crispata TaxID=231223 RepID=A0AAE1A547_9GAST|nr:hypothetical protein RRG08_054848 [Elysia crispata]